MRTTRFWNKFHQVHSKLKAGKTNDLKSLGASKPKGPKQNSQSRRSRMDERGEPYLIIIITCFETYARNALYALNWISTLLLLQDKLSLFVRLRDGYCIENCCGKYM
jgi:hypothetical protein